MGGEGEGGEGGGGRRGVEGCRRRKEFRVWEDAEGEGEE